MHVGNNIYFVFHLAIELSEWSRWRPNLWLRRQISESNAPTSGKNAHVTSNVSTKSKMNLMQNIRLNFEFNCRWLQMAKKILSKASSGTKDDYQSQRRQFQQQQHRPFQQRHQQSFSESNLPRMIHQVNLVPSGRPNQNPSDLDDAETCSSSKVTMFKTKVLYHSRSDFNGHNEEAQVWLTLNLFKKSSVILNNVYLVFNKKFIENVLLYIFWRIKWYSKNLHVTF